MSWNKRRKRITSHEHVAVRENETEAAEVKDGIDGFEEEPLPEDVTAAEEAEKTPGHAYWIHHRRRSEAYARGYYSLPVCNCSNCGYLAGMEKPVCPSCRSIMDAPVPDHIEAPYED